MTNEQKELIDEWIHDTRLLLHTYLSTAESSRNKYRNYGIISAILSAIVGSSVFASIGKEPIIALQISVGIISMSASVLTSIISFLKFQDLAQQYQQTGVDYAALRKELEFLKYYPPEDDESLKRHLLEIRFKWDKIRNDAIPVSAKRIKSMGKVLIKSGELDKSLTSYNRNHG